MNTDAAVILGKFQVSELSSELVAKIRQVMERHSETIIALREAAVPASKNNPLDFETRKQMLLQQFPSMTIIRLRDQRSVKKWSDEVDRAIREVVPSAGAVIYSSKEAIASYEGSFITAELNDKALDHAEKIENPEPSIIAFTAFRKGAMHAVHRQYPKVFPTVDVAVFRNGKLLLARKPSEDKYRFIGGFADPEDDSYEAAAKREVNEEADIQIDDIRYIGSAKVDDWRYRNEVDKVITHLFSSSYVSGSVTAQDDIAELRWFSMDELGDDSFVLEHVILFHLLKKSLNEK